jgi:hypothetical protein
MRNLVNRTIGKGPHTSIVGVQFGLPRQALSIKGLHVSDYCIQEPTAGA